MMKIFLNNLVVVFIIVMGPFLWAFGLVYILEILGGLL